ncbi:MAG: sulfotransferase [Reichenbachiella sp.]|uniref:sulfotransferase family protein n=1 Tax=Reichenbachiella sp. TaxID=2184521 RepID=UPI00296646F2|nr:sulfotransferase [Reichenbachiella sp.]MDW3208492.1 sulfotransferase [Reichenbachiella sp.]
MSNFRIPPISTLSGSTFSNYVRAIKSGRVEWRYYHKVLLTGLVCGLATPFHFWERLREIEKPKGSKSPLFIIGHWRSGTTFLHNLLCQDPNAAYVSTYQSLFPNNMHSKIIFKNFMKMNMPDKRPSDNVRLGIDLPQEDEFALGNWQRLSFYDFFYFPDQFEVLFDRTVEFKGVEQKDIDEWKSAYQGLIRNTQKHGQGNYPILKNPVNTGRVDKLLELFPNAKFLHIYRNPVVVYLSIKKFFLSLFPTLQFQHTTEKQLVDLIMQLYPRLMKRYLDQRHLIPKGQLYELCFEDFEKEPMQYTHEIFSQLNHSNWDEAKAQIQKYLEAQSDYQKNSYQISRFELDRVVKKWAFAFEAFDYDVPENIKVI